MPTQIKVGTNLPQLQSSEYDYDPQRGYVQRFHYDGISQSEMFALQQYYVSLGVSCTIKYAHGCATLTVDDTTNSSPIDDWALDPDDENIDVWLSPKVLTALYTTTDWQESLASIRKSLDLARSVSDAFAETALLSLAGANLTLCKDIYSNYLGGLQEYKNDGNAVGYVLRHTTNAPGGYNANVSDFGVGKIYTTAQLLTETQSTFYWTNPIPSRLSYKIGLFASSVTARSGWNIGWFKCRSTEASAANNRIAIVTKYIFGQWNMNIYTAY